MTIDNRKLPLKTTHITATVCYLLCRLLHRLAVSLAIALCCSRENCKSSLHSNINCSTYLHNYLDETIPRLHKKCYSRFKYCHKQKASLAIIYLFFFVIGFFQFLHYSHIFNFLMAMQTHLYDILTFLLRWSFKGYINMF